MPTFKYSGRTKAGELVDGELQAGNRSHAVELLGEKGIFPSHLDQVTTGTRKEVPSQSALPSEPSKCQNLLEP